MALPRQTPTVALHFGAGDEPHINLSGAACTGQWLWVSGDEAAKLDRLRWLPPTDAAVNTGTAAAGAALNFGEASSFALSDLLDLPGADDDEADLEGLAVDDGWLWLAGSHGLKRKAPKDDRSDADNARRLTKLTMDGNRCLLARVPLEIGDDGQPTLVREAQDGRLAMRLDGDDESNVLTRALKDDPLIGPFLAIPGKDNGFDIEGLAVSGDHLLLGLRGPVLRGWTVLLELRIAPGKRALRLAPLDDDGTLYRKHLLQLGGLGVRDLHFEGDDLLLLAGPTMVLDGDIRIYRWPQARNVLAANTAAVRFDRTPQVLATLPHGVASNRAEALCRLSPELATALGGTAAKAPPPWLVLYDAPGPARLPGGNVVLGDLLGHQVFSAPTAQA